MTPMSHQCHDPNVTTPMSLDPNVTDPVFPSKRLVTIVCHFKCWKSSFSIKIPLVVRQDDLGNLLFSEWYLA